MGERVTADAVAWEYHDTRGTMRAASTLRLKWVAKRMARRQPPDPTDQLSLARYAAVRDELIARGERMVLR